MNPVILIGLQFALGALSIWPCFFCLGFFSKLVYHFKWYLLPQDLSALSSARSELSHMFVCLFCVNGLMCALCLALHYLLKTTSFHFLPWFIVLATLLFSLFSLYCVSPEMKVYFTESRRHHLDKKYHIALFWRLYPQAPLVQWFDMQGKNLAQAYGYIMQSDYVPELKKEVTRAYESFQHYKVLQKSLPQKDFNKKSSKI